MATKELVKVGWYITAYHLANTDADTVVISGEVLQVKGNLVVIDEDGYDRIVNLAAFHYIDISNN